MEVLANSVLFTGSGSRQRKCKVLAVTFKGLINSSGDQEDECEVRQARPNFDMVLNCCENQRCSYHAHPSLATVSHILLSQYISSMTVTINTLAFQFGWKDLLHAVAGLCSTSLPDMELSAVYSSLTAAGTRTVVALSSRKGAPLIVL